MIEEPLDPVDVPGAKAYRAPNEPGAVGADGRHERLIELQAPLRRFVASRVYDSHLVDDIVQETMVRMLQVAPRLEVEALSAYAFTVARNLIAAGARSEATARRNLPRLVEHHEPLRPDAAVTEAEARRALGAALAKVTPSVRAQLLARDLDRRPLHEVADESNLSSGVLASQLHRVRARLRVDYLLALRRVALPSTACEKVLVAISAADRRRQTALQAGQHLNSCSVCSELSLPLSSRDHALAGWAPLPLIALGSLHGHLARWGGAHPQTVTVASTGGALAAVAVAAGVVFGFPGAAPSLPEGGARPSQGALGPTSRTQPPSLPPTTAKDESSKVAVPDLTFTGRPVFAEAALLKPLAGRSVKARDIRVLDVPADEGFWVGRDEARIFVNFAGQGESAVQIRPDQRLSFSAVMTANTPVFVAQVGLSPAQGLKTLNAQRFHLKVEPASLRIR